MLFLPYIFRAIKLIQIFKQQRGYVAEKLTNGRYNMQIAKTKCCLETRNIIFWLIGIMSVYLIIFTAMALTDWEYSKYLPVMMIQECIPIDNSLNP